MRPTNTKHFEMLAVRLIFLFASFSVFQCKMIPDCMLPPKVGDCKAQIARFYFDQKLMDCRQFFYGGCNGNGNRFETYEECMDTCKAQIAEKE